MMKKRVFVFLTVCLFLAFCFAGCGNDNEPEDDLSIGSITITNIPEKILVKGSNLGIYNDTFKVYINASDSQSPEDPSVAKGLVLISDTSKVKKENGTYTVTMDLKKPNEKSGEDPNLETAPWSGTSLFYSVFITPQNTTQHEKDAIWVKGGFTLDKGSPSVDWEKLTDLRKTQAGFDMSAQVKAIYDLIICNDPDIQTE